MVSANLSEGHWELHAEQPITANVTNCQGGEAEVRLQYVTTWKRVFFQSDIRAHTCTKSPCSVLCVYCVHAYNVSVFAWLGEESCPQSTAQWDCWHVAKESLPFLKQSEGEENRTEWRKKNKTGWKWMKNDMLPDTKTDRGRVTKWRREKEKRGRTNHKTLSVSLFTSHSSFLLLLLLLLKRGDRQGQNHEPGHG